MINYKIIYNVNPFLLLNHPHPYIYIFFFFLEIYYQNKFEFTDLYILYLCIVSNLENKYWFKMIFF